MRCSAEQNSVLKKPSFCLHDALQLVGNFTINSLKKITYMFLYCQKANKQIKKEKRAYQLYPGAGAHHLERKAACVLPLWSYPIALYLFVYQRPG